MNIEKLRLIWNVFSLIGFGFIVGYVTGQLRSRKNTWSIKELEEILKRKKGGEEDGKDSNPGV